MTRPSDPAVDLVLDALVVVRHVEWSGPGPRCPWCGAFAEDGHRAACELRAWLDSAEAFCDAHDLVHPARREQLERAVELEELALGPRERRR